MELSERMMEQTSAMAMSGDLESLPLCVHIWADEVEQLEIELAGMILMDAEAERFAEDMELVPEGTTAENERYKRALQWYDKEFPDCIKATLALGGE